MSKRKTYTIYQVLDNGQLYWVAECTGKIEAEETLERLKKENPGVRLIMK